MELNVLQHIVDTLPLQVTWIELNMSRKWINLAEEIERAGFVITQKEGEIVFTLSPSDNEITVTLEHNSLVFFAPPGVRDALKQDYPTAIIKDCQIRWNWGQREAFFQWLRSKKQFYVPSPTSDLEKMREDLLKVKENEKKYLTKHRIYQDRLRDYLLEKFKGCLITGIQEKELLIASHIVPWHQGEARLDVDNVLLLSVSYNQAFDRYLISFSDDGKIVKSNRTTWETLSKLGIEETAQIPIPNEKQKIFLKKHRDEMNSKDMAEAN